MNVLAFLKNQLVFVGVPGREYHIHVGGVSARTTSDGSLTKQQSSMCSGCAKVGHICNAFSKSFKTETVVALLLGRCCCRSDNFIFKRACCQVFFSRASIPPTSSCFLGEELHSLLAFYTSASRHFFFFSHPVVLAAVVCAREILQVTPITLVFVICFSVRVACGVTVQCLALRDGGVDAVCLFRNVFSL